MRMVVQRVARASVTVENEVVGSIGRGYAALVGAEVGDTEADARLCAEKLAGLRVFEDRRGQNEPLRRRCGRGDPAGLPVHAAGRRAPRPPAQLHRRGAARAAEPLLETMKAMLEEKGLHVETGRFRTTWRWNLSTTAP